MKIYIACALTHIPRDVFEEYTGFIHALAAALARGAHVVKYALMNSDPQLAAKPLEERARLCYLWDRKMIEESDVVVAESSFASIGLGVELQIATAKETPIVLCFRDFGINKAAPVCYENPDRVVHDLQIGEGFVSLMALGVPTVFRVVKYDDMADGIQQIQGVIDVLRQC